jgi:pimeloyl-ACP methyl ester carboxylesterase
MALLPYRTSGRGPGVVVLVHGVGIGSRSFDPVATLLADRMHVVVVDRRGYRAGRDLRAGASIDQHLDDLAEVVEVLGAEHGPPSIVGVSGGATIALALALRSVREPGALGTVVVHEPLLGPLAPLLDAEVRDGYRRTLGLDPSTGARYVRNLVGPDTWARLTDDQRARVAADAWVVRAEVPGFLAFAPDPADLAGLAPLAATGRLAATLGERSPAARVQAAEVLRAHTGAPVHLVPGAGHLPQIDAPDAFARVVADCLVEPARCP